MIFSSPILPLWPLLLSQLREIISLFPSFPSSSSGICPDFSFSQLITFYMLMSPKLLSYAQPDISVWMSHQFTGLSMAKTNPTMFLPKPTASPPAVRTRETAHVTAHPAAQAISLAIITHSLSGPQPINHQVLSILSPGNLSNPSSCLPLHYLDSGTSLF